MTKVERCIHCGEVIPEGRMICPRCEKESKGFVKVTRCKECKNYCQGYVRPFLGWCSTFETVTRETGYCHHGERRTDG